MTSYRLVPEWARQDAVILVWPSQNSDWGQQTNQPKLLKLVEQTYLELTKYLARDQIVILVTYDSKHKIHIESLFTKNHILSTNIQFVEVSTDDTWVRDYGPISVRANSSNESQKYNLLDFNYDAWGGKYSYEKDNKFNYNLFSLLKFHGDYEKIDFILEAGNLEINNTGTLLTSSSCFKRNLSHQEFKREYIEGQLFKWLGCSQICWIDNVVLAGDDTDGHIDNLVRFCNEDLIVYSAIGHKSDQNSNALQSLKTQLNALAKRNNKEIVPLPLPTPIISNKHQLPASYTNFLISNNYVFVPVFNDINDNHTLKLLDECFPEKDIIEIESNALIQQFGGIHCASMQIPQGLLL